MYVYALNNLRRFGRAYPRVLHCVPHSVIVHLQTAHDTQRIYVIVCLTLSACVCKRCGCVRAWLRSALCPCMVAERAVSVYVCVQVCVHAAVVMHRHRHAREIVPKNTACKINKGFFERFDDSLPKPRDSRWKDDELARYLSHSIPSSSSLSSPSLRQIANRIGSRTIDCDK